MKFTGILLCKVQAFCLMFIFVTTIYWAFTRCQTLLSVTHLFNTTNLFNARYSWRNWGFNIANTPKATQLCSSKGFMAVFPHELYQPNQVLNFGVHPLTWKSSRHVKTEPALRISGEILWRIKNMARFASCPRLVVHKL